MVVVDYGKMAISEFQGSIFVLALYDVCDEISLSELRPLIGGTRPARAFKHMTPEYVRFERPPVIESLEPVTLDKGERFDVTMQYYDYGVVSVLLRRLYSGTWEDLQQLAGRWTSSTFFDELTLRLVRQRLAHVRAALRKPYENWLSEDYYIFHLCAPEGGQASDLIRENGREISQIVSGEAVPLSDAERREALQASMSYYPNDLVAVGWNAAFVYDTEAGAESTIRLLEYANSQLLQFRHYDELLTRELTDAYRFLQSRGGQLAGWRMRPAAARLRTVSLEVIQLTEHTTNALKFVGDMFSARLYKLCATKIGVAEYLALVHEKLRTADELYDFMIEQFHQSRGFLLEALVVIILVIELVFLFRGK
ncbi:MAG TPA: hypothetical protein VNV88_13980 [Candidatus Solibacter sp.]|nr:hypothetical protein [Candidatus Solibacter sp.]